GRRLCARRSDLPVVCPGPRRIECPRFVRPRQERKDLRMTPPLLQSDVPGYPCRRGKVRDVYDLGDCLVIVATDRISAFDWVLPTGIPDKGRVLTALTGYWFDFLGVPNHLLGTDLKEMGPAFAAWADVLRR